MTLLFIIQMDTPLGLFLCSPLLSVLTYSSLGQPVNSLILFIQLIKTYLIKSHFKVLYTWTYSKMVKDNSLKLIFWSCVCKQRTFPPAVGLAVITFHYERISLKFTRCMDSSNCQSQSCLRNNQFTKCDLQSQHQCELSSLRHMLARFAKRKGTMDKKRV